MPKKPSAQYVPGTCNIGETEIRSRRHLAVGFSTATILLWLGLLIFGAPAVAYILLALPAFIAATSYIQAKERFCAGFGAEGYYNFSDKLGQVERSDNPDDQSKDRKKAFSITARALSIGLLVAAFAAGTAVLIGSGYESLYGDLKRSLF